MGQETNLLGLRCLAHCPAKEGRQKIVLGEHSRALPEGGCTGSGVDGENMYLNNKYS